MSEDIPKKEEDVLAKSYLILGEKLEDINKQIEAKKKLLKTSEE